MVWDSHLSFLLQVPPAGQTKYHSPGSVQFNSVQSLSRVRLFATPWTAAHQASLSFTSSQSLLKPMSISPGSVQFSWVAQSCPTLCDPMNHSLLKLMSIELVTPSSHLILCCPLLLLPPIPPSIRVFSNESTLLMRWPKYVLGGSVWVYRYRYK